MTVADLMFYVGLGMVAGWRWLSRRAHDPGKRPPGAQLRPHSRGAPNRRTSARPWHVHQPGGAASPTGSCLYQRRWQAAPPLRMARQSRATQFVGNLVRALQGGNAFAGPASGQAGRGRIRGACAQRRPHRHWQARRVLQRKQRLLMLVKIQMDQLLVLLVMMGFAVFMLASI